MSVRTELGSMTNAAAAMEVAGLNWEAQQVELVTANGLCVPNHKAIVRSDTNAVLGVVGRRWTPVQPHAAFAFLDTICERFGATYEYAYCLKEGQRIAIQMRINGDFEARPGDKIQKLITWYDGYDGGSSCGGFTTGRRLWCDNQLEAARREGENHFFIQHRGNVEEKVKHAFAIFAMGLEWFKVFEKKCQELALKVVDAQMVEKFLVDVFGDVKKEGGKISVKTQNKHDKVKDLFRNGKGNEGESAWDLYNAATELVDHHVHLKNEDKRLSSAMFGYNAHIKAKALDVALSL